METSEIEFVIEGSLASMSTEEAEERIRVRGGRVGPDVSDRTSYLVAGTGAESELARAEELGVTVLTEEQFIALLGSDEDVADQRAGQMGFEF